MKNSHFALAIIALITVTVILCWDDGVKDKGLTVTELKEKAKEESTLQATPDQLDGSSQYLIKQLTEVKTLCSKELPNIDEAKDHLFKSIRDKKLQSLITTIILETPDENTLYNLILYSGLYPSAAKQEENFLQEYYVKNKHSLSSFQKKFFKKYINGDSIKVTSKDHIDLEVLKNLFGIASKLKTPEDILNFAVLNSHLNRKSNFIESVYLHLENIGAEVTELKVKEDLLLKGIERLEELVLYSTSPFLLSWIEKELIYTHRLINLFKNQIISMYNDDFSVSPKMKIIKSDDLRVQMEKVESLKNVIEIRTKKTQGSSLKAFFNIHQFKKDFCP